MRLRCEHRPLFLKRELGFLFEMALILALLLIPISPATSAVIKMPKPLPDIVKSYKSFKVKAGALGMKDSGAEVGRGNTSPSWRKGRLIHAH